MLAVTVAALALSVPMPIQETVNWTRTYKVDDKFNYHFSMKLANPKVTFDNDIYTTVLAAKPGKAQIQMEMGDIMMSSPFGDKTTSAAAPMKAASGPNGLPANILIDTRQDATPIYVILAAAGAVADKQVKVGDTFQVKWKNQAGNATLDGNGKVLEIDPAAKTLKAEIKYTMGISAGGKSATFQYNLTSVSSTVDGSLVSSAGTFMASGNNNFAVEIKKL